MKKFTNFLDYAVVIGTALVVALAVIRMFTGAEPSSVSSLLSALTSMILAIEILLLKRIKRDD